MTYNPINAGAYTSAFAGAIAGMAVSGWIVDPNKGDYSNVVIIAGAFAQAFDQIWNSATQLNELELAAISAVVQEDFTGRGPGPFDSSLYQSAANWAVPAAACAALILECDAFFASQGINPGTGGAVAPLGLAIYVDTSTLVATANQNGSQTSPYRTYAQANAATTPSGTIYLCSDTFPASVVTNTQALIGLTAPNNIEVPTFASITVNAAKLLTGENIGVTGAVTIAATGGGTFVDCALNGGIAATGAGGTINLQRTTVVGGIVANQLPTASNSSISGNISLSGNNLTVTFTNTTFGAGQSLTFSAGAGKVAFDAVSYASWFAGGNTINNGSILTPGGSDQPGNFWCYQGSGTSVNVPGTAAGDIPSLASLPVTLHNQASGYLYEIHVNVNTYSTVANFANTGGSWKIIVLGSHDNGVTFPTSIATQATGFGPPCSGVLREIFTPADANTIDHLKVQLQRSTAAATDLVYVPAECQITVTEMAPI